MNEVPSSSAQVLALMRLTWTRAFRGKALFVCFFIALAPILIGFALRTRHEAGDAVAAAELIAMTLLSPVFVSASIGDEIEDRTSTYLWSRPLGRWVTIVGKLLALAPIAMILVVIGYNLAMLLGTQGFPPVRSTLAFAAGAATVSTMSAGIATLVPRFGMALAIAYIVLFDTGIGLIPASLQTISVTHQVRLLSGLAPLGEGSAIVGPLVMMVILGAVWLAIGLWRVRRLES